MSVLAWMITFYFSAPSARSLALGGVPLTGNQDPATVWSNPAYLALKGESHIQLGHLDMPIGAVGAALQYNTIDSLLSEASSNKDIISQYNLGYYIIPAINSQSNVFSPRVIYDYFFSNRTLTEADKQKFLSLMTDGYARINTDLELLTFSIASGGFGISLKQSQYMRVRIPRDLFKLILFGNELNTEYSFTEENTFIEELSSIVLTVNYGHRLDIRGIPLYLGVGLRFTRAIPFSQFKEDIPNLGYFRLNSLNFSIVTDTEKIVINGGREEILYGTGTMATGINLGMAAQPLPGLTIGMSLVNIGANLKFSDADSVKVIIFGSDTISSLDDSVSIEPDTQYTFPATGYKAQLPQMLQFSAAYQFRNIWSKPSLGAALKVALNESVAMHKGTVVSLATELHPTSWLPLRFSLAFGDRDGTQIGYGFGLRIKGIHFDFGFQNIGSTGTSSKGGRFMTDFWFSI